MPDIRVKMAIALLSALLLWGCGAREKVPDFQEDSHCTTAASARIQQPSEPEPVPENISEQRSAIPVFFGGEKEAHLVSAGDMVGNWKVESVQNFSDGQARHLRLSLSNKAEEGYAGLLIVGEDGHVAFLPERGCEASIPVPEGVTRPEAFVLDLDPRQLAARFGEPHDPYRKDGEVMPARVYYDAGVSLIGLEIVCGLDARGAMAKGATYRFSVDEVHSASPDVGYYATPGEPAIGEVRSPSGRRELVIVDTGELYDFHALLCNCVTGETIYLGHAAYQEEWLFWGEDRLLHNLYDRIELYDASNGALLQSGLALDCSRETPVGFCWDEENRLLLLAVRDAIDVNRPEREKYTPLPVSLLLFDETGTLLQRVDTGLEMEPYFAHFITAVELRIEENDLLRIAWGSKGGGGAVEILYPPPAGD